jgi:hypothetical protein
MMARIHDTIRDILHMMCRAAGLTCVKEPLGLLPDNVIERPADLYITRWSLKGSPQTNHSVDLTCPLADSKWDSISLATKSERATVVGATGVASEIAKCNNVGTVPEQRARGNNLTMAARCKQQNIHFWPVALEGDGVASPGFLSFINNVCDAAQKLKGANRSTFKASICQIIFATDGRVPR